jgi:DNA polymerase-3 subunit delta'
LFKIDKVNTNLPWLAPRYTELDRLLQAKRFPHALLVHGRRGTGRRQLAFWLAETILGVDPLRTLGESDEAAGHPDMRALEPLDGKASISVDQIRELVDFFRLTSHGSAGRLALLWPADSMTISAANSLLKTLEEPPPGCFIVLIAESTSRLPATIVSRCQRIRVPLPPRKMALEWLEAEAGQPNLDDLLDFAGGAPLAALQLHAENFSGMAAGFSRDIEDLRMRRVAPIEVAARWNKTPSLALEWLSWKLAGEVRRTLGVSEGPDAGSVEKSLVLQVSRACFKQLEQIRELRRLFRGGISTELSLAGLLMGWYGGLGN